MRFGDSHWNRGDGLSEFFQKMSGLRDISAGLTAHVYEEQTEQKPMRKMFTVETEYDGPEEKDLP